MSVRALNGHKGDRPEKHAALGLERCAAAAAAYTATRSLSMLSASPADTMDLLFDLLSWFESWFESPAISDAMAVGGSVQCAPGPFPAGVGGAVTRYNGIVHGSNRGFVPKRCQ